MNNNLNKEDILNKIDKLTTNFVLDFNSNITSGLEVNKSVTNNNYKTLKITESITNTTPQKEENNKTEKINTEKSPGFVEEKNKINYNTNMNNNTPAKGSDI